MSAKATFWAWEQKVDGLTKLVLLSLSNYANDQDESWHSYASIAKATGISRQSVITHCQKLEEMGLLLIKKRRVDESKNLTNVFKLLIRGSQGDLLGVVKEIDQGSQGAVPKTKKETKIKTNNNIVPIETSFEEFWKEITKLYKYNKFNSGSKQEALKVFKKLKLVNKTDEILTKTNLHLSHKRSLLDKGIFTPNPKHVSGWLNNKCWEDELDIAVEQNNPTYNGASKKRRKFGED